MTIRPMTNEERQAAKVRKKKNSMKPTEKMTGEQIIKMCERLAYRYNNKGEYEDLVQEGVLKCYEMLADDPDIHPANLYREANRRMYDYLNFDCHGLSIPASDTTRSIARGGDLSEHSSYSETTTDLLKAILSAEWGEYDDETMAGDQKTPEEILGDKEVSIHIMFAIDERLDPRQRHVILRRYVDDATQAEVGDELKITHQAVHLIEKEALRHLYYGLCNKM